MSGGKRRERSQSAAPQLATQLPDEPEEPECTNEVHEDSEGAGEQSYGNRSSFTRLFPILHELLLSFDEFLGAVDAALVEHEIAYRRLDQHGEVPARRDGNGHLADRHV